MLRVLRIILIAMLGVSLIAAGILFYYNYTHEDVSRPVFQAASATMEVSVHATRQDLCAGLKAYDNLDGDITDRIMVQSISKFTESGTFQVRYIVFDNASNYAVCERTAHYTDYTPPRYRLTKPMVFNVGETVSFLDRISAEDCIDGDLSSRILLMESNVSNSVPSTYRVVLAVTNSMGDTATLPLSVQVKQRAPSSASITLSSYLVYQAAGTETDFRQYIAAVTDPLAEGEISKYSVTIDSSALRADEPGVYDVNYLYTGASGEPAEAILTVIVE